MEVKALPPVIFLQSIEIPFRKIQVCMGSFLLQMVKMAVECQKLVKNGQIQGTSLVNSQIHDHIDMIMLSGEQKLVFISQTYGVCLHLDSIMDAWYHLPISQPLGDVQRKRDAPPCVFGKFESLALASIHIQLK